MGYTFQGMTKVFLEKSISLAAELMKLGGLVAFPTETVYGLGASIFNISAIANIFEVKGRPADNPLIAHVSQAQDWVKLADNVPSDFHRLTKAFFPGPLTLIVRKKEKIPLIATGGLDTIAIRCPDKLIARQLIFAVNEPIVAPSANISGRPSSTTAQHVLDDFNGKIAAVVDDGPCCYGLESTVVDLVSFDQPTLMRPGVLRKEAIEKVLEKPLVDFTTGPKSSPGVKYHHYSPEIPVHVFKDTKNFERYLSLGFRTFSIPSDKLEGKTLYAFLRLADESGYENVAIDSSLCSDMALMNRLEKMSEDKYSISDYS